MLPVKQKELAGDLKFLMQTLLTYLILNYPDGHLQKDVTLLKAARLEKLIQMESVNMK